MDNLTQAVREAVEGHVDTAAAALAVALAEEMERSPSSMRHNAPTLVRLLAEMGLTTKSRHQAGNGAPAGTADTGPLAGLRARFGGPYLKAVN